MRSKQRYSNSSPVKQKLGYTQRTGIPTNPIHSPNTNAVLNATRWQKTQQLGKVTTTHL